MMLKSTLLIVTFFSFSLTFHSQNCEQKIIKSQEYIESRFELDQITLDELKINLEFCLENTAESLYLEGLFALHSESPESLYEAHELFFSAANLGNVKAMTHLGYSYLNGWNDIIDYQEAINWFELAFEQGDPNAAYALGYLHLKGLGTIEQDYEEAIMFFESSSSAMAKHWLAFCSYFGFGKEKNLDEAEQLFNLSNTDNSRYLKQFLFSDNGTTNSDLTVYNGLLNSIAFSEFENINNHVLTGLLIEKDWSNTYILKEQPIYVKLMTTQNSNIISFSKNNIDWTSSSVEYQDNSIFIGNLDLTLDNLFPDDENHLINELNIHKIDSYIDLSTSQHEWILNYNNKRLQENENIISLLLVDQELINDRIENSILYYPNYFDDYVNLSFSLEKNSTMSIELINFSGYVVAQIPITYLIGGTHNYSLITDNIPAGQYILKLTVDGYDFNRQVLKN